MISSYPVYREDLNFAKQEQSMEKIIGAIRAIRNRRAEMNVPMSQKSVIHIVASDAETYNEKISVFFQKLAFASSVKFDDSFSDDSAVQIVVDGAVIYIPLAELIDFEKELKRLEDEHKKLLSEIDRIEKKLSNPGFVAKAPESVISGEKSKLLKYQESLDKVISAINKVK
jgi:valyl-tRNA synthetase